MDQETLRLLITASAAILGALGGAGVTALINHKNTVKQLAAAKAQHDQQWLETRAVERERWTREKRIESYSAFIRAGSPLVFSNIVRYAELLPEGKREIDDRDEILHHAMNDVLIFGSSDAIRLANEYRRRAKEIPDIVETMHKRLTELVVRETKTKDLTEEAVRERATLLVNEELARLAADILPDLVDTFTDFVDIVRRDCGLEGMGDVIENTAKA